MSALSWFITIMILLSYATTAHTQWDQYDAVWNGKPGRMMVNLDFKSEIGLEDLNYLLEVTEETIGCDTQGFPYRQDLDRIELSSRYIDTFLSDIGHIRDVGRFIYQCTVKDYFYMSDTSQLASLLSSQLGTLNYKIIEDPEKRIYLDFIYPDEFLQQTMVNSKIINLLQSSEFDLEGKSELMHFASFASDDDRNKYRRFVQEQNFKIIELDKIENSPLPYRILFTRSDKLQLQQLSNITLRLHQKANFLNGLYEGWEIEVDN